MDTTSLIPVVHRSGGGPGVPTPLSEVVAALSGVAAITATGTVTARSESDRFATSISAKDCGAIGDGTSHPLSERYATLGAAQAVYAFVTSLTQEIDWAAITLSINLASAARIDAYLDGGLYLVGERINVPANTRWRGPGRIKAKDAITQAVVRINNVTSVRIEIAEIDGNKANCPSGGAGIEVVGASAADISIVGVYVHDCKTHGISLNGDTFCLRVLVQQCRSMNNGNAGITCLSLVRHCIFANNHAEGNATHGIGILGVAEFVVISGNTADNNGPSSDNFTGYNSGNHDILIIGNTSRGAQNHGIHFGGDRISYVGNLVYSTGVGNGIRHENHDGTVDNDVTIAGNTVVGQTTLSGIYAVKVKGLAVTGNTASANVGSGIWVQNVDNGVISGNTCRGNTQHGILATATTLSSVSGNNACENGLIGIGLTGCSDMTVVGNVCNGNASDGCRSYSSGNRHLYSGNICRGNTGRGIRIEAVTTSKVIGNLLNANTSHGFWANTGAASIELVDNDVSGNTAGTIDYVTGLSQFTRIERNRGYNPVGVSSITVGASPYTYTAGPSPEIVFITGGTVSSIVVGGVTLATATGMSVPLSPGQPVVVTYSGLPTMKASVQ